MLLLNNQYFLTQKTILSMDLLHTKSIHSPYINRGIYKSLQNKKASIRMKLKLFKWALMDSNHRPSACKAGALLSIFLFDF